MRENFRGLKNTVAVIVVEGDGKEIPFREVYYVYDLERHGGTHGGFIGKIDPFPENMPAQSAKTHPHYQ